jgi:hypothetical protein
VKRLAKAEKLLNEQMLAILEWAAEHPKRWHDIGKMPESRKAGQAARQAWCHRDSTATESIPGLTPK